MLFRHPNGRVWTNGQVGSSVNQSIDLQFVFSPRRRLWRLAAAEWRQSGSGWRRLNGDRAPERHANGRVAAMAGGGRLCVRPHCTASSLRSRPRSVAALVNLARSQKSTGFLASSRKPASAADRWRLRPPLCHSRMRPTRSRGLASGARRGGVPSLPKAGQA
jgi:hypothetical protein